MLSPSTVDREGDEIVAQPELTFQQQMFCTRNKSCMYLPLRCFLVLADSIGKQEHGLEIQIITIVGLERVSLVAVTTTWHAGYS